MIGPPGAPIRAHSLAIASSTEYALRRFIENDLTLVVRLHALGPSWVKNDKAQSEHNASALPKTGAHESILDSG
jgi:hypothetical protein